MTLPRSAADVLSGHVVFEIESIDRMYLNVWQPRLQHGAGAAAFFTSHRGHAYASTALMDPMTKAFVADIHHFIGARGVDLVHFGKERKDEVTQRYLADFTGTEGVLYAGRAQEKATVWRTQRRYHADGSSYAWLVKTSALVNFFYFYCVDADFGPFFIKFCTYFPYTAKLCINGHEWAKRQAARAGIGFEALDNGFAAGDAAALQAICDRLGPPDIDALLASGCASCRTRSPPMTSPPATPTSCPSCRPSSPSPRSWTRRSPGGSSSSRSSGTTWTSAARTRSRWSSPGGSSARAGTPRRAGSAPASSPAGWSRACTSTTSTPRSSSTTSSAGHSGPRPPSTTHPPTSASPSGRPACRLSGRSALRPAGACSASRPSATTPSKAPGLSPP